MNDTPYPQCSRDGDDFAFMWTDLSVRIAGTRIREDREGLDVELDVATVDGHPLGFDVLNILSSRSKAMFANGLGERHPALKPHWRDMVEQCALVIRREWRRLPPPVDLLALPRLSTKDVFLDDHGLAIRQEPVSWYGAGDNAKSLIALGYGLAVAAGTPFAHVTPWRTGPVLYLDFEDQPWVAAQRMRAWMAGLGIDAPPPLLYRQMNGRCLTDVARALRTEVSQEGIALVIVDSYIMAAGADPEKSDTARRFHGALRWLDVASIVISHTTKLGTNDVNASAYGSVVFTNQCRSTWLFFRGDRLPSDSGRAEFVVNALHKKRNLGEWPNLAVKIGMTLEDRLPTQIEAVQAQASEDLDLTRRTLPLHQQIEAVIVVNGAMPVDVIAERLEKDEKTVRTILGRYKRRFTVVRTGEKGRQWWGLLSTRTDDPGAG